MFVDTGGWIPADDPPAHRQSRIKRPQLSFLKFVVLSVASGLAVLLVIAIIVEGMIAVSGN